MQSLTIALELDVEEDISTGDICAYIKKALLTHPDAATVFEPKLVRLVGVGRSMVQRTGVTYSALGFREN